MKIFIVPTSYPNSNNPQKNIFIYEQAKKLANMDHEIVVLHVEKLPTKALFKKINHTIKSYDDGFAMRYSIQQKTFVEGKYPLLNKNSFINNMNKLYEYAANIHGKPDVIYAHFSMWAGYSGVLLSKKYGIPLVTIEHFGGFLKHKISKTMVNCTKTVISNSKYFLCVSEGLKNSISNKVMKSNNMYVLPNMVDESFKYSPKQKHKGFIFLGIGRLTSSKNFDLLIKSFVDCFSPNEDVFLRIAGDGEEYSALYDLIKINNRENQIKLLGRISREETIKEYKLCDTFVLPSSFETYGIVYREALATGRPIITSNHGGFSQDDWHDEYGLMITKNNVDELSKSMRNMYNNINNYNCKEISKLCLEDCSSELVGKRIESFLKNAVDMEGDNNE